MVHESTFDKTWSGKKVLTIEGPGEIAGYDPTGIDDKKFMITGENDTRYMNNTEIRIVYEAPLWGSICKCGKTIESDSKSKFKFKQEKRAAGWVESQYGSLCPACKQAPA